MQENNWRPTASIDALKKRAQMLQVIRDFFRQRSVTEVETPLLASTTVTDPHLDSIALKDGSGFLQTSPEYFMKRLLAAGSGDIYSLGKVFREDEQGQHHNPEFTMLEWYRIGLNDRQLAAEVIELVTSVDADIAVNKNTYAELFEAACGLNPHRASVAQLQAIAKQQLNIDWADEQKSLWLDLLFTHLVEPSFSAGLQLVFDYPACQSALAKTCKNADGALIARRFELYWNRVELANGYWELTDAIEQKRRFESDIAQRKQLGKPLIDADAQLLNALDAGMPKCAGVALGVDRLLMCLTGSASIDQVISFTRSRS